MNMSESKDISKRLTDELLQIACVGIKDVEETFLGILSKMDERLFQKLKEIRKKFDEGGSHYDEEDAHCEADQALLDCLNELGMNKSIEAFCDIPKWYS